MVNCAGAKTQGTAAMNKCTQKAVVNENIDGCKYYDVLFGDGGKLTCLGLTSLPGGHQVQYSPMAAQTFTG